MVEFGEWHGEMNCPSSEPSFSATILLYPSVPTVDDHKGNISNGRARSSKAIYFIILVEQLIHHHKLSIKTKWNNSGYITEVSICYWKPKGFLSQCFCLICWHFSHSFISKIIIIPPMLSLFLFQAYFPLCFLEINLMLLWDDFVYCQGLNSTEWNQK